MKPTVINHSAGIKIRWYWLGFCYGSCDVHWQWPGNELVLYEGLRSWILRGSGRRLGKLVCR